MKAKFVALMGLVLSLTLALDAEAAKKKHHKVDHHKKAHLSSKRAIAHHGKTHASRKPASEPREKAAHVKKHPKAQQSKVERTPAVTPEPETLRESTATQPPAAAPVSAVVANDLPPKPLTW